MVLITNNSKDGTDIKQLIVLHNVKNVEFKKNSDWEKKIATNYVGNLKK